MKKRKPVSRTAKIRQTAELVIMICLLLIVIFSGLKIITITSGYNRSQHSYDDLSEQSRSGEFTGDIDFASLRSINPDVVGWLYYKDTVIDYPVVQGSDNDVYLHTMFDGSEGDFGTLFVDFITEKPFEQFNTIIYGHHMKNGSMFGGFRDLKSEEYCEEHPRFELVTPKGKYHLDIWAFLNQPSNSRIYIANIYDREERADYINMIMENSEYVTGVRVTPDDRLVTMSTCAYEYKNARYIVVCKMVPWE